MYCLNMWIVEIIKICVEVSKGLLSRISTNVKSNTKCKCKVKYYVLMWRLTGGGEEAEQIAGIPGTGSPSREKPLRLDFPSHESAPPQPTQPSHP